MNRRAPLWRGLAVIGATVLMLIGCGGKAASVEGCHPIFNPDDCPYGPRVVDVTPRTATIAVGGTTTFSATETDVASPTYQWFKASGGGPAAAIQGANAPTFTVSGAQLVDDGTRYTVAVSGSFDGRSVRLESANPGELAVSSMPGVLFEDAEFAAADWTSAAIAEPAVNGPTFEQTSVAAGGNPGAWRRVTMTMPAGVSRLDVFATYQAAAYDPATQGAIYVIELNYDCTSLPGTLGAGPRLLIEQAGRRYTAGSASCAIPTWTRVTPPPGRFGLADFVQVDGPACAGGACPDFSAAGGPIRFGFANANSGLPDSIGGSGGFGVDNWKVTVWRR